YPWINGVYIFDLDVNDVLDATVRVSQNPIYRGECTYGDWSEEDRKFVTWSTYMMVLSESIKRQKIGEASGSGEEQSAEKEKELSEEELQKLLAVVLVEEVYVEALQVKYPTIDWEVYSEDTRRFSTTKPTDDKEKELWVELNRLFEPDNDDILWKLQRYMHDPLRNTIFMMGGKLLVEAASEMSRELLRKNFYQANKPRQKVVRWIDDEFVEEVEKLGWWFEQDIGDERGWMKRMKMIVRISRMHSNTVPGFMHYFEHNLKKLKALSSTGQFEASC
ncbi:hypothetical protein Tco_0635247, partial [Tanacetum coccineum]